MNKPILYVLCGIPGSGKSYFAKHINLNAVHISRDEVRFSMLEEDAEYFSKEDIVFHQFTSEISHHLKNNENVIADATHISVGSRKKLLAGIDNFGFLDYSIIFIYFNTPYEICLGRNSQRTGRALVPQSAMESMYKNFRKPSMLEDERCIGLWLMKGN